MVKCFIELSLTYGKHFYIARSLSGFLSHFWLLWTSSTTIQLYPFSKIRTVAAPSRCFIQLDSSENRAPPRSFGSSYFPWKWPEKMGYPHFRFLDKTRWPWNAQQPFWLKLWSQTATATQLCQRPWRLAMRRSPEMAPPKTWASRWVQAFNVQNAVRSLTRRRPSNCTGSSSMTPTDTRRIEWQK